MKRLIPFLLFLVLSISACAPASPATDTAELLQPKATLEEAQAASQSAVAPQETPLPVEINAPLIEAPGILNIEMLDEVFGWGVTEENIVRTNDGGVTWYDVTPAKLADAGYLVYPDFFDANHAWIQFPDMNKYPNGGKLYRTSDGGNTWESFTTPFSGGAIHFIDEQNGWVLADLGVGAGSMAVSVFKTGDGGATWQRVYTNDPNLEGAADTLPLGGIKNIILPLDLETAWVGGVVYASGETYLYRSDDGGKTWFNINLVLPEGSKDSELSVYGIRFTSTTDGLLAIRVAAETPQIIVYATHDGGTTWSQLPITFDGYGLLETPSASEMIFYTAGQFYVTKDAGMTIEQVTPDIKFGDTAIDMSFVNSQTGWLVTSDSTSDLSLYKTTDGGATWFPIIP
ncbi:MAG: hypothetical protein IPJ47_02525 [Anaerolineales bacterium]|nr:hypothetical protein [Anaerolineales bacterium]